MEKELIPISALQHWLFCQRQCCLIHMEREWAENTYTAEGNILHARVDEHNEENRGDRKILRALPIASKELGLTGQADVVEILAGVPYPVEYKRGKPKSHRADEVQLCGQAVCLEEMFDCEIRKGALYYDSRKRRTEIELDNELRQLVCKITEEIREAIDSGVLPKPLYVKNLCEKCSLVDVCKPKMVSKNIRVNDWILKQLETD